jgi:3-oxoacyl-[acyl-carrier-protein] synthase II
VAHACDLIRRGEAPMMVAGAADSMLHPFGLLPFVLLGATTTQTDPDLAGRPFDKDRDGFVMGEGAAFFVLEPLSRARAAGRRVYGVVLGHGTSCDAYNVTAPHPEGAGAERAMRAALADAGLPPSAVDYVNAHGTGTPLNDVTEAAAIARVFGDRVAVSSSKGQLGHAIAAAGAVELAACLAAFAGGRLPPNAHLRTPDPKIAVDLVEREGRAATPSVILSNSFGFGGQNACLLLGHPDTGARE